MGRRITDRAGKIARERSVVITDDQGKRRRTLAYASVSDSGAFDLPSE
jgi:hypothetical protein